VLCKKCQSEKSVEEFSFRDTLKSRRHHICKACHTQYRHDHYLKNREKYIVKAHKWNIKQREVLKEFILEKLKHSSCRDCGESDILVLDFDHVSDKKFSIAHMFKNNYSVTAIEQEMAKCIIRCSNCHRRKTAKEVGYWKSKVDSSD